MILIPAFDDDQLMMMSLTTARDTFDQQWQGSTVRAGINTFQREIPVTVNASFSHATTVPASALQVQNTNKQ